jgi:hypothetical protein
MPDQKLGLITITRTPEGIVRIQWRDQTVMHETVIGALQSIDRILRQQNETLRRYLDHPEEFHIKDASELLL